MDEKMAERIWQLLITSGSYAFNVAHAVSYTMLGFWTAWLKNHYPMEFYAASLAKASGDAELQFKLMRDALAHGIDITPPRAGISRGNWRPHVTVAEDPDFRSRALVAGWQQIPGIGAKTAEHIEEHFPDGVQRLSDLIIVPGIGDKTIAKVQAFGSTKDPFGLYRTERKMHRVRRWLGTQKDIPYPTATGDTLAAMGQDKTKAIDKPRQGRKKSYVIGGRITYAGVVRQRNYKDAVEATRAATGKEADEILKTMYRPDLLEYCSIRCYDDTEEEIYVRVNRFKYPKLKRIVESITENHDVIICVGHRIEGFGTPMQAEKIWVVDPD
jgi:DNA polymerase-3 subunit alpha